MDAARYIDRTLDDRVVQDTLSGLFSVDRSRKAVSGGMSVQHYIPGEYRRPTTDIDFTLDYPFGPFQFRGIVSGLDTCLTPKGYRLSTKKRRESLDIEVEDTEQGLLTVQFSRRSASNYEIWRQRLSEEVDRAKQFSTGEVSYPVLAPENIVARKIKRSSTFVNKYGLRLSNKGGSLRDQLAKIRAAKADYFRRLDQVTPEDLADLRLMADVYDLSALNMFCDLDREYFGHVTGHWDNLRDDPVASQMVHEFLSKLRKS